MNSKIVGMKKYIPTILISVLICAVIIAAPILLSKNKNQQAANQARQEQVEKQDSKAADDAAKKDSNTSAAITAGETSDPAIKSAETPAAIEDESSQVIAIPAREPVLETGDAKVIYLTFDDGPSGLTDEVLDILDEYGVKATFFVTAEHPSLSKMITEIADRGHAVGAHSYLHQYDKVYASVDAYLEDLEKISNLIEEKTGVYPNMLRFPGGTSNTVSRKYCKGLMTSLAAIVGEKGFVYFDWNVASNDTSKGATVQSVIDSVVAGCKKHQYNVVLQHDFKRISVDALKYIIEWGQESGYEFRALSPDAPQCHQRINN